MPIVFFDIHETVHHKLNPQTQTFVWTSTMCVAKTTWKVA